MILVRSLPGFVLLLFLLAGCGSTPASNLASDAGLIKEGVSTKNAYLPTLVTRPPSKRCLRAANAGSTTKSIAQTFAGCRGWATVSVRKGTIGSS